jgi:dissimilatory sulfite reductase (desulfoviridin) alpha/beta subunit
MKIFLVSIACSVAEIVTHPIDTIKTKLQLDSKKRITKIVQKTGIPEFYKSLKPALARHWIYSTGETRE